MMWKFDENRGDFLPVLPDQIKADPDAFYIVQRSDVVMVREGGHERPMPERLDVCGLTFDRERFEGFHPLPSPSSAVMHALYTLADYPVLAALAAKRTQARKLDGRACRAIYQDALHGINWQAMSSRESDFVQQLGLVANPVEPTVTVTCDGEHLIAHLGDGRVLRHHDAVSLADLLLAAGVTADDVRMPDWRAGDIAPGRGHCIAIFYRMRQAALRTKLAEDAP